jgi:Flp pilus assembly protein TadD
MVRPFTADETQGGMTWWQNLLGGRGDNGEAKPDYYQEGVELLRQEKFHDAMTSFRLALKERPDDLEAMQQLAVTYTRIGMTDEALRTYRRVLDFNPHASAALYGLAFLLLNRGEQDEAISYLRAFLARPPKVAEANEHVEHARSTLASLTGEAEL